MRFVHIYNIIKENCNNNFIFIIIQGNKLRLLYFLRNKFNILEILFYLYIRYFFHL